MRRKPREDRSEIGVVDPRIRESFGVFRRARSSQRDALPSLDPAARVTEGENVRLSRRAAATPSGDSYYLVPGRNSICLFGENGSGGCTGIERAMRGDLIVSLCAPRLAEDQLRVIGMFPDGVASVTFELADGTAVEVPVQQNALAADFARTGPKLPLSARWTAPAGDEALSLPIPPDAGEVACGPPPAG
jgi:hypothetical protein